MQHGEGGIDAKRATLSRGVVTTGIMHWPARWNQGGRLAQATSPSMCVMLLFALGTIFATIFAGLMREWILMIVGIALAVFFVMAAYWDFPDD